MNPGRVRKALRGFHLAMGVLVALVVYPPILPDDSARLVLAVGILPLLTLSGVAMWQQARLRRWLGRGPARTPARG